jgi:hypothetical protein
MTSLEKLNVSQLPPHEAFYSTLKNGNISAEDYQLCPTRSSTHKGKSPSPPYIHRLSGTDNN